MGVVEGVSDAGMHLNTIKLNERRNARVKADIQPAYRAVFLVVRAVNDAAVRSDRQSCPMLKIFARCQVYGCAVGRADAIRTNSKDHSGPIQGFRYRNKSDQYNIHTNAYES